MASTAFGVIADDDWLEDQGVYIPDAPQFPDFPTLVVERNETEPWAFNETLTVGNYFTTLYKVKFEAFEPDKEWWAQGDGTVHFQRYGPQWVLPYWFDEPIAYENGTLINGFDEDTGIDLGYHNWTPDIIIAEYNGTYSNFIIDPDHPDYEAFVSFFPMSGYDNMTHSWYTGYGFECMMYGNAWAPPDWTSAAGSYLYFFAEIIGFVFNFLGYMVVSATAMFQLLNLAPEIATILTVGLVIVFLGALLTFIRGNRSK